MGPTEVQEREVMTIRDLIGTLLASETIAHVILVISACVTIHTLTRMEFVSLDTAAIMFISLSAAYSLTAVGSRHESISKYIRAKPTVERAGLLAAIVGSVLMPVIIAVIITGVLLMLISSDGIFEAAASLGIFPWTLAILFCVWSLMQAAAFRSPAETLTVKFSPLKNGVAQFDNRGFRRRVVLVIFIVAIILHILFFSVKPWIDPTKESPTWFQAIVMGPDSAFPLSGLAFISVCASAAYLLLRHHSLSLSNLGSHHSGQRRVFIWSIIILGFATWHLFSFHRKFILGSTDVIEIAEEVILMVITVLSAIWALSNRAKTGTSMFTQQNAVFWAAAFAYGYAGSISIISNGLLGGEINPIQALGIGHLVTAIGLCAVYSSGINQFQIDMDELALQKNSASVSADDSHNAGL